MRKAIAALAAGLSGCTPVEPPASPRPPRPPSCVQVADHVPDLVDLDPARERRVRDAFHARCSQDRWSAEARACIAGIRSFSEPRRCKAKLTPAQRAAFDKELAIAMKLGDTRSRLPPECAEYASVIDRLGSCSALNARVRETLQQSYRDAAASWANLTDEQLASAAVKCRADVDSVKRTATSPCGW